MRAPSKKRQWYAAEPGMRFPGAENPSREAWDQSYLERLTEAFGGKDVELRPVKIPVDQATPYNPIHKPERRDMYRRMYRAGDRVPPVFVRRPHMESGSWAILDGSHRWDAARLEGVKYIDGYEAVEVQKSKPSAKPKKTSGKAPALQMSKEEAPYVEMRPAAPTAMMKSPAFRHRKTGEVIESPVFHNSEVLPYGEASIPHFEDGFVDHQGKFYNREEAALAVGKPQYGDIKPILESQNYAQEQEQGLLKAEGEVCPKCGSKSVVVRVIGEPVFECEKCKKHWGVPFSKAEPTPYDEPEDHRHLPNRLRNALAAIRKPGVLTDEMRNERYRGDPHPTRGYCYVATEALAHLINGPKTGWQMKHVQHEGDNHFWLQHKATGAILDPTWDQFKSPPPYDQGVASGPMHRAGWSEPSKKATEAVRRVQAQLRKSEDEGEPLGKEVLDPSLGYTIHVHPAKDSTRVSALGPNGNEVGYVNFSHDGDDGLVSDDTYVYEQHQRQGIASAMYREAEKVTGRRCRPSSQRSYQGAMFWLGGSRDQKQFGMKKAEQPFRAAAFRHRGTSQVMETGPIHETYALPGFKPGYDEAESIKDWEAGFVTHDGRFMNRAEAAVHANIAPINRPGGPVGLRSEQLGLHKAVQDLQGGTQLAHNPKTGEGLFDYSHLLPVPAQGQYRMLARVQPKTKTLTLHIEDLKKPEETPAMWTGNWKIGKTGVAVHPHEVMVSEPYRRQGLGLALTEAAFTHARQHLGASQVHLDEHSTAMSKVLQKLSRRHGLGYQQRPNIGAWPYPDEDAWTDPDAVGDYDGRFAGQVHLLKTDSPAFQNWFRQSKVVDAAGKPQRVFHGSNARGGIKGGFRRGRRNEASDIGIWFADRPEVANGFADIERTEWFHDEPTGERVYHDDGRGHYEFKSNQAPNPTNAPVYFQQHRGGHVTPVYLSMKNPKVYETRPERDAFEQMMDERDTVGGAEYCVGTKWDHRGAPRNRDETSQKYLSHLRSLGHDGVVLRNTMYDSEDGKPSHQYVVFDPTQAKSAIGNSGTFDPNDPNLGKAEGHFDDGDSYDRYTYENKSPLWSFIAGERRKAGYVSTAWRHRTSGRVIPGRALIHDFDDLGDQAPYYDEWDAGFLDASSKFHDKNEPTSQDIEARAVARMKKSELDPNAPVAASVLVEDWRGRVLFGRRQKDGKWTLPGGHLEAGEEPAQGAAREMWEECGLTPNVMYSMGVANSREMPVYMFKAIANGEPHSKNDPDHEVQEWRWVDVRNGLPADVAQNLAHNPNVVLRYLGWTEDQPMAKSEKMKWAYHGTHDAILDSLRAKGLNPGYVTTKEPSAAEYSNISAREQSKLSMPIVLRFPLPERAAPNDLFRERGEPGPNNEYETSEPVPAANIQYRYTEGEPGAWQSLLPKKG